MKKTEPNFMQRCWDCRKIIWTYDKQDPDRCKSCFKHPSPATSVTVVNYNFEYSKPSAYNWMSC